MSKSRNHCFTLNNPTEGCVERILEWECNYVVVGEEVGESGTPHLQGYVEWAYAKPLTALKKLDPQIHWEERKGTAMQAAEYCKKDGQWHEEGKISSQGKRSDLETVAAMVVAKQPMVNIATAQPGTFVRYHKGLVALQMALLKHREGPPYVEWRHGDTGAGKTRYCVEKHPSHYIKDSTQWWDGYNQQEAIIVDDFDPQGKLGLRDLLRLLDRYKYLGQFKGGYVPVNSPYIYVTADHPPQHYWRGKELEQVLRRINSVVLVGGPIPPTTPNTGVTIVETP